jgi:glucose/arabinose dehydrogenase
VRRLALVGLAALALAGCGDDGGSSATTAATTPTAAAAPATTATTSTAAHGTAIGPTPGGTSTATLLGHEVTIPKGWTASVFARLNQPRWLLWTPQKTLLVTSPSDGTITEISTDGKQQHVIASGLTQPQGMAFDGDTLYVAESDAIDRYRWEDGKLGPKETVIGGLPDTDPDGDDVHRWKSVIVGPDHLLYLPLPSSTNAGLADQQMDPPRGTVAQLDPKTGKLTIWARGIRNGEGLAFAPDGSLWTAVNNRDNIADPQTGKVDQSYVNDHPPEEVARLTKGRDLGWPTCNPEPDSDTFTPDAQTNPGGKLRSCDDLEPIEVKLPAHNAPLGLNFVKKGELGDLPAGATLALHGSWNSQPPKPPGIVFLPWKDGTLQQPVDLMRGFQDASGQRWGRTVDAVVGPDGALYVSDDQAGAIYRLAP